MQKCVGDMVYGLVLVIKYCLRKTVKCAFEGICLQTRISPWLDFVKRVFMSENGIVMVLFMGNILLVDITQAADIVQHN